MIILVIILILMNKPGHKLSRVIYTLSHVQIPTAFVISDIRNFANETS